MEINTIDIIRSFYQGNVQLSENNTNVGNCASIALIKASIEVFEINNVVNYSFENNIYNVTLKNNITLSFSKDQLERSNYVANFKLNSVDIGKLNLYKQILEYAQILMCSMVVMVTKIGESGKGIGDFEEALKALNDGANSPNIPRLLGLENHYKGKTKWQRFLMKPQKGMIAWLSGHTVFMSNKSYDYYGNQRSNIQKYPNRLVLIKE